MLERFWHGCGHCQGDGNCHLLPEVDPDAPVTPESRLPIAWTAMVVFLLPLGFGIAAAALAGRLVAPGSALAGFGECVGLLAGFGVGVAAAKVVLRIWCRWRARSEASEGNA